MINYSKLKCPRCGSPGVGDGQPSLRQFYGCGSYDYGDVVLADTTELCIAWADLAAVTAERDGLKLELEAACANWQSVIAERDAVQARYEAQCENVQRRMDELDEARQRLRDIVTLIASERPDDCGLQELFDLVGRIKEIATQ